MEDTQKQKPSAILKAQRIVLLGFSVPDDYHSTYSASEPLPQTAARKLEMAYINGLQQHQLTVDRINLYPASTYPDNKTILFKWRAILHGREKSITAPFINLPGLKLISRFISLLLATLFLFLIRGRPAAICTYSTHTPLLLTCKIFGLFTRTPTYAIVPDLPEHMFTQNGHRRAKTILKAIDRQIIQSILRHLNGISCVTQFMPAALGIFDKKKYTVIEGIYTNDTAPCTPSSPPIFEGPYFLYAGSLIKHYGIDRLIQDFTHSSIVADLVICGAGPYEKDILAAAKQDTRIKFLGYVDQARIRNLQENAIALLLTRDPHAKFVQYSFPSKLIEYMASATPTISSHLPCIPPEYMPHLSIFDWEHPNGLLEAMELHLSQPESKRKRQGEAARTFIIATKNAKHATRSFIKMMCATGAQLDTGAEYA